MSAINLTLQNNGLSFVVNTNIIYRVYSYNGGSKVFYGIGGAIPYEAAVVELPSAIAAACSELILVTTADGAEYIFAGNSANGDGKGVMTVETYNTTGSKIFFKYTEEATPIYIYSTDSKTTIANRINALVANASLPVYSGLSAQGTDDTTTSTTSVGVNIFSTVTVSNFCTKLPNATSGDIVRIVNNGAANLRVFPYDPLNSINGLPAGAYVVVPNNGQMYEFISL